MNTTTQVKWGTIMPEYLLFVTKETLTDKSEVYDVVFGQLKFAATSQDAAEELADAIADAINTHTTQTAKVISTRCGEGGEHG